LYAAGNTFAFLARSNPSAGEGGAGSFVEGSFFLVHQTNVMNLPYGHLEKPGLYVAERAELTARLQF